MRTRYLRLITKSPAQHLFIGSDCRAHLQSVSQVESGGEEMASAVRELRMVLPFTCFCLGVLPRAYYHPITFDT